MYRATKFKASSVDAQAQGVVFAPYLQILQGSELDALVEKYGLDKIEPESFYPQAHVCEMQSEMAEKMGLFSGELVAIGKESVPSIGFPPEIQTMQAAFEMLHSIYQAIHQNIPAEEGWVYESVDENAFRVVFNAPYEEFAAYGYVWGIVEKFRNVQDDYEVTMGKENDLTVFSVQKK